MRLLENMPALTSLTLAGFGKRASSVPANEIFAHKFRLRLDELTLVAIVGFHIDNLINFREEHSIQHLYYHAELD